MGRKCYGGEIKKKKRKSDLADRIKIKRSVRDRKRERQCVYVSVSLRERNSECVFVRGREREREVNLEEGRERGTKQQKSVRSES